MKSVRLHGTGDLQIHDESIPVAGVGEKLVRVRSVGVCGSDLHWFSEGEIGDAKLERPLVLGMSSQARRKMVSGVLVNKSYCKQFFPRSLL